MALRSTYVLANNNRPEAMPFLRSFRQTKFDARVEEQNQHMPEIDNLVSNRESFQSNREGFQSKGSVDTNANVGVDALTSHPRKTDSKIDYDNMYFTDEEIPVMGYTSGDENSPLQLLQSREGETDAQPVHKLMAPKPDSPCPYLVIDDLPTATTDDRGAPEQGPVDSLRSHSGSGQSHKSDLPRSSDPKSEAFDQYCTVRKGSGRSGDYFGGPETSDSGSSAAHAQLVSERAGEDGVKLSLGSRYRDGVKPESEGSIGSSSDSDDAETERPKPVGSRDKSAVDADEPIHMTLEEVRSSLRNMNGYPESVPSTESAYSRRRKIHKPRGSHMHFGLCLKPRSHAVGAGEAVSERSLRAGGPDPEPAWLPAKSLKHTLCNWFGIAKCGTGSFAARPPAVDAQGSEQIDGGSGAAISGRALPPVPQSAEESEEDEDDRLEVIVQPDIEQGAHQPGEDEGAPLSPAKGGSSSEAISDFASSIQKVKDCGWYWGPISGEMAEKILSNEPDGSFILRDSSDEYYIFSLTFKLNGFVRHVRIEHEQGNFSFGTFTKFKSHTIVEFIENAVQHSRSGRYLFFIHRRPVLGPMRVQLLHPVSRFKQVQSLQHTCRFVILKAVRRDLIECLPIPKRLKDYLNTPHYYTEQMQEYQNIFAGGTVPTSGDNANANVEI